VETALTFARSHKVTIESDEMQTLQGFGASGAWWPNDLILFPESVQANLSRLLFSADGLQMSSYRYNMGADGGPNANNVSVWEASVESFLLGNGTYNFSRDHAGVTFLKYAQEYEVPYITFFINAAPAAIASNHAACGYDLQASVIPAFASYITTVLSYWSDHGINISFISPMNEPDNNRASCTQEGMAVAPALRPSVFSAIRSSLDANPSARHVQIIGDETSQILQADAEYPIWLASASPYLSHIAIHNYDYPDDTNMTAWYDLTLGLTSGQPPPVMFTETCCSTTAGNGPAVFGAQYDPTITNALIVARYVWQFMTIAQAVGFDWWTAVTYLPCSPILDGPQCATNINETAGYNSGLVYIDPKYNQTHDYTLYLTKRFWTLRHLSFFIRPGAVRHAVDDAELPDGVEVLVSHAAMSGDRGSDWHVTFFNNHTST